MEYEKNYDAKVIGETIGKELKSVLENSNVEFSTKDYLEREEYRYKKILYFINISAIISYIAGALALQLPFIDKFGIMSYDFKLYLLLGTIIFVVIQLAIFISSVYELIVSHISAFIENFVEKKLYLKSDQTLCWLIKICFIPITLYLIEKCEIWLRFAFITEHSVLLVLMLSFIKIYVIFSLIFQDKKYGSNMNTTNFMLIIIALTASLYVGRSTIEEYLLTDVKLINSQGDKNIELLLIDNKAIYYKEHNTYKYEILQDGTLIEFQNDDN